MRFEKPLLLTLGLVIMFQPTTVYAGKKKRPEVLNYWLVGTAEEHTLFSFVDASTVTYDGATRSAWVTKIAVGAGISKHGMRRSMALTIFNCEHNTLFESRIVEYNQNGEILLDHSYDKNDFHQITSGSAEATELGFVCANPENWTSGKAWSKIDTAPEVMADTDNKAFQGH